MLPAKLYPLQDVLSVLHRVSLYPQPNPANAYLIKLELCNDDFRGGDWDGNGLALSMLEGSRRGIEGRETNRCSSHEQLRMY